MQGGEELSIDELASNLSTYKDQLQQVRKLLVDDPRNSEYVDMEKELEEKGEREKRKRRLKKEKKRRLKNRG